MTTPTIRQDDNGGTYVWGHYGTRYAIDSLTLAADHDPVAAIDEHLAGLPRGHPDVDLLLDARNEAREDA